MDTPRILAEGQLASSKGTLYTVPSSVRAQVTFFAVFNTSGSAETTKIYIKPGSTSRQIEEYSLAGKGSARVVANGEILSLEAGDLIEGESTSATTVNYIISGVTSP